MNKKDLVDAIVTKIAEKTGEVYTKKDVKMVTETAFEVMKDALAEHKTLDFYMFGKLIPKLKPARKGRNPRTGETIDIPEKYLLSFKASTYLKKAMNPTID